MKTETPKDELAEKTTEELHALIKDIDTDAADLRIQKTKAEAALSKALAKVGGRLNHEPAERPKLEVKTAPPVKASKPARLWIRDLGILYACCASTAAAVLAMVTPIWFDASEVPMWAAVTFVLAAAGVLAFLGIGFLLSVIAILLPVYRGRSSGEHRTIYIPATNNGWSPPPQLHSNGLDQGVPVMGQPQIMPAGGAEKLDDDPQVSAYLNAIKNGQVSAQDQFSDFLGRNSRDIDPMAF